ncbi:MAG: saccharopine dehydrogenase NADP-binding domain-containing protein, partial [Thermoleophilia bacterium]|nr:saccharopine dehydrogenase NADP-binding domain-containing protein [Thermoleophilia bacterium]
MKVLVVGVGGVGESIAAIAKRRDATDWLETMVLADYDRGRAERCAAKQNDPRFVAEQVDASDADAVAALAA